MSPASTRRRVAHDFIEFMTGSGGPPASTTQCTVVGAHVEREQGPAAVLAHLAHRAVVELSHRAIKLHWRPGQLHGLPAIAAGTPGQKRRTELVVRGVHRAALIPVQPRAVRAKAEEVGERVVVHTARIPTGSPPRAGSLRARTPAPRQSPP